MKGLNLLQFVLFCFDCFKKKNSRNARVEGFRAMLDVERVHWRQFPKGMSQDEAVLFVYDTEQMLVTCMDKMLLVESQQLEKISQFEELQAFGVKMLRYSSNPVRSMLEDDGAAFVQACSLGQMEDVSKLLCKQGSKKKQHKFMLLEDESGATGAHLACRSGHALVLSYLLKTGFPVDSVDSWHGLPLVFWAVSNPSISCDRVLSELEKFYGIHVSSKGKSALHFACKFGNLEAVTCLVEKYSLNVNEVEEKTKRSPLHISCSRGYMGVRGKLLICFSLS